MPVTSAEVWEPRSAFRTRLLRSSALGTLPASARHEQVEWCEAHVSEPRYGSDTSEGGPQGGGAGQPHPRLWLSI